MTDEQRPNPEAREPTVYQIRIKGHLSQQRMGWFEGLTIVLQEDGNTLLSGPVIDQSALHGILKKIRDLGTPLLSVSQIEHQNVDTKSSTKSVKPKHSRRRKRS